MIYFLSMAEYDVTKPFYVLPGSLRCQVQHAYGHKNTFHCQIKYDCLYGLDMAR